MPVASEIVVVAKLLRWVTGIGLAAGIVSYPVFVYTSLSSHGKPTSGRLYWLVVPFGFALLAAWRSPSPQGETTLLRRLLVPSLALVLLGVALALDALQPLLLVPVLINAPLLATFLPSLWTPRPLIERFARLQHPDLNAAEQAWCRLWTVAWSGFFGCNIVVAAVLGLSGQVRAWALYNGLITYVIMGVMFAGEYIVRKYRFGRYAEHLPDRLLRRLLKRSEVPRHDR